MANISKNIGKISCLLALGFLSGCANFVGGNLSELLTDASLNSKKDLENYKFDLLPSPENSLDSALSASETSKDSGTDPIDNNSFETDPVRPVIQLHPVQKNTQTKSPDNQFMANSDNSFIPRQNQLRPVKTDIDSDAILKPVTPLSSTETGDINVHNLPDIPASTAHDFSGSLKPNLPDKKISILPPFASHPPCKNCNYKSYIEKIESSAPFLNRRTTAQRNEPLPDFVEELISQSINPDAMLVAARNSTASPINAAPTQPITWSDQLQKTIEIFESEIPKTNSVNQKARLTNSLQLLRSMRHNLNQTSNVDGVENQYWHHQIRVLNTIMDDDTVTWPVAAANALTHLNDAAKALRESATLRLNSVAFCRKVSGYGQYETFGTTEFVTNQKVLVYCEIENFVPSEVATDDYSVFETRISSSFSISDSSGKIVQNVNFPAVTDQARKIRSDFFMHIPIQFSDLRPGTYELQLDVHDLGSGKYAKLDKPLVFSIR